MAAIQPFFFQNDFAQLNEKQISERTRALLDAEIELKGTYSIEVQKNVPFAFFVEEQEPAVDIKLYVTVAKKIQLFFKALFSGFSGWKGEYERTPHVQAIAEFFEFKEVEGVSDVKAAHKQGRTIHLYVGLNTAYKRLRCVLKGSDTIQNAYKATFRAYCAFNHSEIDKKVCSLLRLFSSIKNLNRSYRSVERAYAERQSGASLRSDRDLLAILALSKTQFRLSMQRVTEALEITPLEYINGIRAWQAQGHERHDLDEIIQISIADSRWEHLVNWIEEDTDLYPIWCNLLIAKIMEQFKAIFEVAKQPKLAERLTPIPQNSVAWTALLQSIDDTCGLTDSLKPLRDILVNLRFFLDKMKDLRPGKKA